MHRTHLNPRFTALLLLTAGLICAAPLRADDARRTVVDAVDRSITVPTDIHRVFSTSPVANNLLYTLAPDRMIGWNYRVNPRDAPYLLKSVRDLPVLGGWFGPSGTGNRETLLAARPELILSIGSNDHTSIDFANRLQSQLGVPVFVTDSHLDEIAETYMRIGALLGNGERASELADYCRAALAEAREFSASIPPARRLRVYYAEGPRGLQTWPRGSLHSEIIELAGAENVLASGVTDGSGRADVSLEHLLAWKPDVILICPEVTSPDPAWTPDWLSAPGWSGVKAVANGRVHVIPIVPFNWFGRPPSVNRFLGLKWAAWSLYPDLVRFDMVAETRRFFRLFYHYDLSEAEAKALLDASRPLATPHP